jgi:methylmalonyl-CoA mutase N-terminal domain/subunit
MGGMIAAIESNFPQREIANSSYEYQKAVERGDKVIVGVNAFRSDREDAIEILQIDQLAQKHQAGKLAALRASRNNGRVRASLDALRRTAEGTENTMPFILDAVRAYATLGEVCDALREVFGSYQETSLV